jgi:hypothetical protein
MGYVQMYACSPNKLDDLTPYTVFNLWVLSVEIYSRSNIKIVFIRFSVPDP